ncbi:MAG: hypothetical protein EOO96_25950 [Pedobacter sp.]|nr:MAG: hypothetical protein EOO96_25950 [Pedobacter sp.]
MSWIYYLLEANLYLSVFYIFYRLVLHKETFYVANRFYLLCSVVFAFLLPFLQIGFLLKPVIQYQQIAYSQAEESPFLTIENGLLLIYGMGAAFLLLRLLVGFKHIIAMLAKADVKLENGLKIIELSNTKTAFSFFSFLFIDPSLPQKNIVVKHEMVHINQKHSVDVLLFEFVQILSWFNPLVYLLKKDIKLIHEYLADEATTNYDVAKYEYAMFLIQNTYDSQNLPLTNQIFNSSILKQRISMLNQKKSAKWARLRLLITLPLAGAMVCVSTMAFTKNYGVLDLYPKTNIIKFTLYYILEICFAHSGRLHTNTHHPSTHQIKHTAHNANEPNMRTIQTHMHVYKVHNVRLTTFLLLPLVYYYTPNINASV